MPALALGRRGRRRSQERWKTKRTKSRPSHLDTRGEGAEHALRGGEKDQGGGGGAVLRPCFLLSHSCVSIRLLLPMDVGLFPLP